jgi:hypothetical protein
LNRIFIGSHSLPLSSSPFRSFSDEGSRELIGLLHLYLVVLTIGIKKTHILHFPSDQFVAKEKELWDMLY